NEEEPRVADRTERVDAHAARLLARRSEHVEQRLRHGGVVTGARVKSREDEDLHVTSPPGPMRGPSTGRSGTSRGSAASLGRSSIPRAPGDISPESDP